MTIAFDIDGTWDRDPTFWTWVYNLMPKFDHTAIFVTGREQPPEKLRRLRIPENAIVIVSGPLLKEEAAARAGYKVDVWIDDMPGMIQRTAILDTSPNNL
jgi:hypothetical protein